MNAEAFFLLLIAIAVVILLLKRPGRKAPRHQYRAAGPVLTAAELRFFHALNASIDPSHYVLAKVRLIDLIEPLPGLPAPARKAAKNRVIQKHVDFVICDRESMRPIAALELNDKSHDRPDRKQRDNFMTAAFSDAGVPLHFVPVRRTYEPDQLRALLADIGTPAPDHLGPERSGPRIFNDRLRQR
jgi:hypothetical protein